MKVRKIGVSTKLFFMLTGMLLLANAVLGGIMFARIRSLLIQQIKQSTVNLAKTAAAEVDGDAFEKLKAGDEDTPEYKGIFDELAVYRDNSEIEYIYATRQNPDGQVVYVVDTDPSVSEVVDVSFGSDAGDAFLTAMSGTPAANAKPYKDQWGTHLSACAPIRGGGGSKIVGVVSIDISMSWVDKKVRQAGMDIIGVCAAILACGVVCLYIVSRLLHRKFEILDQKLLDLTDGSGDLTKEITLRSGDEFELIGVRINTLMGQIRALIQQVAHTSENVVNEGVNLQYTLEGNVRSISEMNDGISSIRDNMQDVRHSSETASGFLERTAEQIQDFAKHVEQVEQQTAYANRDAEESAKMAREHRDKAIREISEIQHRVQEATEGAKVIERVQDIAAEINAIASKTKILSLNAQIEAARAGEQGRGFAVVAGDVENLSSTIAVSVREINEITRQAMESVSLLADQSSSMSEFMTREVVPDYDAFVNIGQQYGDTMGTIQQSMSGLRDGSTQISRVVEEVNSSIQEISTSMGDSAQRVSDLSDSSADISNSMEKLRDGSEKNVEHTAQLNEQIGKYQY